MPRETATAATTGDARMPQLDAHLASVEATMHKLLEVVEKEPPASASFALLFLSATCLALLAKEDDPTPFLEAFAQKFAKVRASPERKALTASLVMQLKDEVN